MYPRGPTADGKARHFVHYASSFSDCEGGALGESDLHRKWKSMAVSGLKQRFEEEYVLCRPEVQLDVTETESSRDDRRADALLEFESPHDAFGQGLIVEVQYRNEGKDIEATTHDYLAKGYSVYWATEDDFSDTQFKADEILDEFHSLENAYVATTTSPEDLLPLNSPSFFTPGYYFDERVGGPDDPQMRQNDDCDHRWQEVDEYCYSCLDCSAQLYAGPELSTGEHPSSGTEVGYAISLAADDYYADLRDFEPRGKLVEVVRATHPCYNCGVTYAHVVGFHGGSVYDVSTFGEQISDRSDVPLRNVGGEWRLYCPVCDRTRKYTSFDEMTEIYYTGSQITTAWVPANQTGTSPMS